jgi:two-component system phosphate regulon sensor histidine kinase PhoR
LLKKHNILVVDNDAKILYECSEVLTNGGYRVRTAESGKEALLIVQKGHVDIVILDLEMPDLSGMQVLRTLRQARPEILVIVLTGEDKVAAMVAVREGAYDCILKSFTPDQLQMVVRRASEKKILQSQVKALRKREMIFHKEGFGGTDIKNIVDSIADGILVTDKEGRVILHNPRAATMVGVAGDSILGQSIRNCVKNDSLIEIITKMLTQVVPPRSPIPEEICLIEAGGVRLRVHISPIRNKKGELIGTVTLLHDVAHISLMDRVKSEFVAMVSHELKSPLSSTLLQISIVLDEVVGKLNKKQKDLLNKSKGKIKSMITLMNDLLDVCRIEEGRIIQQMESLNLSEVLQRTVDLMRPQSEDKDIDFQTIAEDGLPPINGNRSGIEALFINLISNAIKYTPSGGEVRVEMAKEGKNVQIKVSDTGIGMENVDIARIFDKFYRVRSDRTKDIAGTGLGLSIVKGVVDAHRGSVSIESKVGKGTTFTISLPII